MKTIAKLWGKLGNYILIGIIVAMAVIQPHAAVRTAPRFGIWFGDSQAKAAGTADYSLGLNGTVNAANLTTAINALPSQGGLFHFKVGTYNISSNSSGNITRAFGNMTIEGEGKGTLFTGNGTFVPGGANWVFTSLAFNFLSSQLPQNATWNHVYTLDYPNGVNKDANGVYTVLNLTATNINMAGNITPTANNTYNVGSSTNWWANVWTNLITAIQGVFTTANITQANIVTGNISTLNAPTGRGATYVIAASDANLTQKAQADYIANGTSDQNLIQSVINVATRGDVIQFVGYTFNVSGIITVNVSGLTFQGQSSNYQWNTVTSSLKGTTIKKATGDANNIFVLTAASNGTTFRDLCFDSSLASGQFAIEAAGGATNLNIFHCAFLNDGIEGSSYGDIYDNNFFKNDNIAIKIQVNGFDFRVTNNIFSGGNLALWTTCMQMQVIGNVFEDIQHDGIIIDNGHVLIANNVFRSNPVTSNAYESILVTTGGLDLPGVQIVNNNFEQWPYSATTASFIRLSLSKTGGTYLISGNTFDFALNYPPVGGNGTAISITSSIGNTTGIKVTNNIIRTENGTAGVGVKILSTNISNAEIINNTFSLCTTPVSDNGTNTMIRGNNGYVTENSGNVTLVDNTNTIAVTHGLATTPTWVQFSSTSNETGWLRAVAVGATTFNISSSYNVTANTTIYWRATVGAGN